MRAATVSLPLRLLVTVTVVATVISAKPVKDQYELETAIQDDINVHRVMVYSKTYCPYSRRLKALLQKFDIDDMKVIELNREEQMSEMQDFLETLSGRRTVPQLFLNGQFVGGFDDVKALDDEGEFEKRLMQAGAIPWRV
ncbi:hypothetical protein PFISCL1PPCAC_26477 [Pristionchus fissidentatus]|uniref:Glutaredoxin domain-containing protein n=1 Tax=Pristionchus fissidentatus TaxID=1538716 RepID=A0AAV5WUA6_9BILA|nr:hypothetical protein PFISCL1PPCAC_26477 [Pristionchus fissidentatus]